MTPWERWALGTAAVVTLVAAAEPARAEEHKDTRLGYSITYPRKWQKRPVAADERWIVGKFECDREYEDADPKSGFWSRHRPWLDVVVIPLSLQTQKGGQLEKNPDGTLRVNLDAPFKDMKGYLETTLVQGEGGFYFSREEESTVGGVRCIQYEVTFDKLIDTPKRVHAWAYYTSDAIYGLVGETLVKFEDKVKPDLFAAFRSFKAFQRTGVLQGAEKTGEDVVLGGSKEENLDDDARQRNRERKTMLRLDRIKSSLASDWTIRESKRFIGVSHADPKFTKAVLDHCEALRTWLDENLGYVGTGYAGRVIVRICKDRDEYDALTKTGGWDGGGVEVTTYKDKEGFSDWGPFESMNRAILRIWTRDRNQNLAWSMPRWIDSGIDSVIGTAEAKGAKIEFRPSTWDKVEIATARRDGKLLPAKDYFTMTSEDLWKDWSVSRQSEYLVRFLLVGGARKNPKYKNLLADYVKAVVFVVDEEEAARAKAEKAAKKAREEGAEEAPSAGEPKDEKEEEEMIKARQQDWGKREKDFLAKVYQRVFSAWTIKDWEALTSAYWRDLE